MQLAALGYAGAGASRVLYDFLILKCMYIPPSNIHCRTTPDSDLKAKQTNFVVGQMGGKHQDCEADAPLPKELKGL